MNIDIEDFYKRYGPMVLRRCRFLLKDEDAAQDAMQDVFIQVLKHQNRLKGQYPSSLLYRIATNICLNKIRESKKNISSEDSLFQTIAGCDDVESSFILKDMLQQVFHKEHVSTKTIAVMHYLDGLTLSQVADEVGMSVSGVRKRLRKLRAVAKNELLSLEV